MRCDHERLYSVQRIPMTVSPNTLALGERLGLTQFLVGSIRGITGLDKSIKDIVLEDNHAMGLDHPLRILLDQLDNIVGQTFHALKRRGFFRRRLDHSSIRISIRVVAIGWYLH